MVTATCPSSLYVGSYCIWVRNPGKRGGIRQSGVCAPLRCPAILSMFEWALSLERGERRRWSARDADPLIARGQPSFEDGGCLCLSICEVPFFVWNKATSNEGPTGCIAL